MDEWSASKADLAKAIWDRLLGFFGESLLRKFGAEPPQEWEGAIGALTRGQLERGMRRLLFGWNGGPPSLPDFMRLCRSVGSDDFDEGPQPIALEHKTPWHGDKWDEVANTHLLAHIAHQAEKGIHYCSVGDRVNSIHRGKDWKASRETQELTAPLVAYKTAWARDMREWGVDMATGQILVPSVEEQKRSWTECMARADAEIDQIRRQHTAGMAA